MIEFRSAIVDECGEVMYWCDKLTKSEISEVLNAHPEWQKTCVEW